MKYLLTSAATYIVGIALLFITTVSAAQNTGNEIVDTWWNQEKEVQIEIYQSCSLYAVKIV